jgi:hypothetical protein
VVGECRKRRAKKSPPDASGGYKQKQGSLLYFGITLFLEFGIDQIPASGFGLGRDCKTVVLEFPVFNERAIVCGVIFILIAVLFLLGCFGFVDFKSAAQIQLVQVFMFNAGIGFFGVRRQHGAWNHKGQAHQYPQQSQNIQVLHSILPMGSENGIHSGNRPLPGLRWVSLDRINPDGIKLPQQSNCPIEYTFFGGWVNRREAVNALFFDLLRVRAA